MWPRLHAWRWNWLDGVESGNAGDMEIARLTQELADAVESGNAGDMEIARLTQELADAVESGNAGDMEIARLTQDLADARDELTTAQTRVTELESELEQIKIHTAAAITSADKADRIARETQITLAIGLNPVGTMPKTEPEGVMVGEISATRDAAGAIAVDVNGEAD